MGMAKCSPEFLSGIPSLLLSTTRSSISAITTPEHLEKTLKVIFNGTDIYSNL
jgi:hypothetical protein